MSRVGLGRHGQLDSDAGDPLDGLVNLFDVGIVLAVGFLVAGLSLGAGEKAHQARKQTKGTQTTLSAPSNRRVASGRGSDRARRQRAISVARDSRMTVTRT